MTIRKPASSPAPRPPGQKGQGERMPFELTCAGQADFELPPPQPPPPPGVAPPAPLPTIARFDRNVQLKRGNRSRAASTATTSS
ncbi:MAG: hypothetical protein U0800_15550 [Isosphaeraceae bacterium]